MINANLDSLTPRHLQLFGAVVQWFAQYELLMTEIGATVSGSDPATVMLLTRRLDFAARRQTLLDLLRHRGLPMDRFDRIRAYLVIPHNLAALRDNIAHSSWRPGSTAAGVQPNWILRIPKTVKATHGDPAASEIYVEDDDERVEYTLDDLAQIVESLAGNFRLFLAYAQEVNLIRAQS